MQKNKFTGIYDFYDHENGVDYCYRKYEKDEVLQTIIDPRCIVSDIWEDKHVHKIIGKIKKKERHKRRQQTQ